MIRVKLVIDRSKFIPKNYSKTIIYNETNIGQIKSIDKNIYSLVKTEFIFHCEDDWEFYSYGFIEKSINILSNNLKYLQYGYVNIAIKDFTSNKMGN